MSTTITVVGRENIPGWRSVTADGYIGNSANPEHINKILGVSVQGCDINNVVQVMTSGELYYASWNWTRGYPVFVNGTRLSHLPPTTGFQQVMGLALDSLRMSVRLGGLAVGAMSKMWNTTLNRWVDVWVAGAGDARFMEAGEVSTSFLAPFITKFQNTTTGRWASVRLIGEIGAQTFEIGAEDFYPATGNLINVDTSAWVPVTIGGTGDGRYFELGTEI